MRKNEKLLSKENPLFDNQKYLNVDDVVSITGLAKKTIYNLCSLDKIPHLKQRKRLVFIPQEIQQWFSPTGG